MRSTYNFDEILSEEDKSRNLDLRTMMIRTSLMRFVAAFIVTVFVGIVRSEECSRTCIAQNCDTLSIRYGKYCGIGHSGCPGEEPCDELDACCQVHDNCVESKGMTNISCHKKFQRCLSRLSKSITQSKNQKVGFSTKCPYSLVLPTMNQGMDIGILFSQLGTDIKVEL